MLVVLRIYVALALFQPYGDLEAGDNRSLKFKWQDRESNSGPLALQAKSLTTRPPPLPFELMKGRLGQLVYSVCIVHLFVCMCMYIFIILSH